MGGLWSCITSSGIKPEASMIEPTSLDVGDAIRASARSDAKWPSSEWWNGWNDGQLDSLISRATSGSPTLAIVRSRVTAAVWEARALHANQLPELDSSADIAHTRFSQNANPSPPGGETNWNNSVALDLTYDLDIWGKNRAIEQGAQSKVHAAVADEQFAKIELQAAVARAYNAFALQYALADIYAEINQEEKRNLEIAASRKSAGIDTDIDVTQARTQYQSGLADIIRTRDGIEQSRLLIAYLVGEGPGFGASLQRPLPYGRFGSAVPASLPAEFIGHRPDIVAQRWRVTAASKEIDVAHADFYPNIDLVASASLQSLVPFGGFFSFVNSDSFGHSVGIAASLPIFDAERRRGKYGVATAEYDDAVLKYNDAVLLAMREVAEQVTALRSLEDQELSVDSAVESSKRSYELANSGYRGGVTEYLDVLVSQKIMLQQQINLALVRSRQVDSWIALMKALGGGFDGDTGRSNMISGGSNAP
ncbi:efflux transporter outer membrane subunit [Paraburkholderia pallida]|nr:efflux transporter outer membrane subunit [Paraburkholderia pallida]